MHTLALPTQCATSVSCLDVVSCGNESSGQFLMVVINFAAVFFHVGSLR
jgi:hypothetical protein